MARPLRQPHVFQPPPQAPPGRPSIYPSHYDGKTGRTKAHFEVVADLNGWDNQLKASYLAVSLRGQAQVYWETSSLHRETAT